MVCGWAKGADGDGGHIDTGKSFELFGPPLQGDQAPFSLDGCSTVVLIGFTCPAMTVATVILRALDRVRDREI